VILGIVMMIVGIVGAFLSYVSSRNYSNQLDVGTAISYSVAWLTLVVAGAALFIRYGIAAFLRLWLLRQLYEGQANTDRLVEAIADRG
jgi:hypothetical protein